MSDRLQFRRQITARRFNEESRSWEEVTRVVDFDLDISWILAQAGSRAVRNRTGRASQMAGGVVAKVRKS